LDVFKTNEHKRNPARKSGRVEPSSSELGSVNPNFNLKHTIMTYQTTKLTLIISLILFVGFADLAFGQIRRPLQQQRQPAAQPQQPAAGQQQRATPQQGAQTRQPAQPATPQQRVLIISAGHLPQAPNFGGLNGADFDADALARAFEHAGIPRENIVYQNRGGWTRDAIMERTSEIAQISRRGDSLVIILIGRTITNRQGDHFFCAVDTTDATISGSGNTGLVDIFSMGGQIVRSEASHKALILDLVGNDGAPDFSNLEAQGLWLLTSAATGQESLRESGLVPGSREVRGVFNFYLAQGILGMADLVGNNDGVVSFNELSNYVTQNTRAHAARAGVRQTPQMIGEMIPQPGVTVFNIGRQRESALAMNRHVFDESHLISFLSDYLAFVGNAIVMSAQAEVSRAFAAADEQIIRTMGQADVEMMDVTDYLRRQGDANAFAIANFLRPAVDAPENRMARLAIATAYRAWGNYDAALRNYNEAGELFELYIVAQLDDMGGEITREDRFSQFGNDLTIDRVPLRNNPSTTSQTVAHLRRGEKVFVQDFSQGASRLPNDDWIKVRAYPTAEPVEGWVHRDYLFWSPEAAEWFTPEDGLQRMYNANAERFMAQARALEADARAREMRGARVAGITSIVGQFVPYGGYVQRGGQVAAAVAFSRASAQRGAAIGAQQQSLHWQQVGAEHRANARTVEELTRFFDGARIVIDPNDLPF